MESEVKSSIPAENKHKVFKNNPKYFKSLLNKTVEITTVNGKTHKGIVYVVDPVSESVVTVTNCQEKCDVNIFMGHAIQSLHICNDKEMLNNDYFKTNTCKPQTDPKLSKKKSYLAAWLKKNLINVEEDGLNLKLGNDLLIVAPYDKSHCFCSNTIILQRVQDIIDKMPDTM